jgi:hypothetical protein
VLLWRYGTCGAHDYPAAKVLRAASRSGCLVMFHISQSPGQSLIYPAKSREGGWKDDRQTCRLSSGHWYPQRRSCRRESEVSARPQSDTQAYRKPDRHIDKVFFRSNGALSLTSCQPRVTAMSGLHLLKQLDNLRCLSLSASSMPGTPTESHVSAQRGHLKVQEVRPRHAGWQRLTKKPGRVHVQAGADGMTTTQHWG